MVRTRGFHPLNGSSILPGAAIKNKMAFHWQKGLMLTRRIESVYGVIFVFVVALSVTFAVQRSIKGFRNFTRTSYKKAVWFEDVVLSEEEKARIDQWIKENDLNRFGEPKKKVYVSFPLVDEVTGERIDRYRYILSKHPNRPWHE